MLKKLKINGVLLSIPLLVIGIFLVHHKLIEELLRQDFRTYLWIIDFVYKKTFDATGSFPLWQNYLLCGISYIVNIPFLFSVSRMLTLAGVFPVLSWFISEYVFMIAGTISFFYLMRLYKCRPSVSFFGALMFQFLFYRFGSSEGYPIALAPIVFLFCEKYDERPDFIYILLGAVCIGITCSSGIVHGVLFILILQFLLAAYYMLNGIYRKYCIAAVSSWVLGFVLSLPTLLPQIIDAANSQRLFYKRYHIGLSTLNIQGFMYKLNDLLHFRNFFPVSVIAAILTIITIFYLKEKKIAGFYLVSFFVTSACVFLSFMQGAFKDMPFIGKYIVAFDINRMAAAILFIVIFLATYTINSLINKDCSRHKKGLIGITSLVAAVCSGFICLPFLSKGSLLVRSGTFLFILTNLYITGKIVKRVNFIFAVSLAGLLAATFVQGYSKTGSLMKRCNIPFIESVLNENALFNNMDLLPGESADKKSEIMGILKKDSASTYFRSVSVGINASYNEVKFLANQIYSPLGMANIYTARYYDFFKWLIGDLRATAPERYNFFVNEQAYPYEMGSNYNEHLLSLAGVKWVLAPNAVGETRFKKVIKGNKYSLYHNDKVLPRAFAVFNTNVLSDKKEMAVFMMNATSEDFAKSVPILASDALGLLPNFMARNGNGTVKIIRYKPNEVLMEVDFSESGLLVLTDNFHRSWHASVDSTYVKIYPAYYTFRMVEVPKGKHIVRFYFFDKVFHYSMIFSIVALFGIILIALLKWLKTKFKS